MGCIRDRRALCRNWRIRGQGCRGQRAIVERLPASGLWMRLVSSQVRGVRIDREEPRLRDRYGRHIHGQSLLLARRLVEAGVGLVTVNWHNDGQNFWDTHGENFHQLKNRLMPTADQGFAALLEDLDTRAAPGYASRLGGRVRPDLADNPREQRPRALPSVLFGRPGRRRECDEGADLWERPIAGLLIGQRSRQPRRPGSHDLARPGHRAGLRWSRITSIDRSRSTTARRYSDLRLVLRQLSIAIVR